MTKAPRAPLPRWREAMDQANPQALLQVMEQHGVAVPQAALGGRRARLTCCFHEGAKGANLSLFQDRQSGGWRYHCKVCQAAGSAIEFLQARRNLSKYEALYELGRRDGPEGHSAPPVVPWRPQQWKGITHKLRAEGGRPATPEERGRPLSPMTALYQHRVAYLWTTTTPDPARQAARAYATRRAQRAGVSRDLHASRTAAALAGHVRLWPGLLDTGRTVWDQLDETQRAALESAGVPRDRATPVYLWPHRNKRGDVVGVTATPAPAGEAARPAPPAARKPVCWGAPGQLPPVGDQGAQKFLPVVVTRSPWFAMSVSAKRGGGALFASRADQLSALPAADTQHLLLIGDHLDQPSGKRWLRTMTYGAMRREGDVAIGRPPRGGETPDSAWVARAWATSPDPLEYVLRQANQLEEPLRAKVLAERLPALWARTRQPALRAAYQDIVASCLQEPEVQRLLTPADPLPSTPTRHAPTLPSGTRRGTATV